MTATDKCKAFLLDVIFPNRCQFCGDFIKWDKHICGKCEETLRNANDIICRKCGKGKCICGMGQLNYDRAFAAFIYNEELVSNAIYRFKKTGEMNIAEYAVNDIVLHIKRESISVPDIIVPVPMGKKKRRRRGHNQAELLAKCIGKNLDRPVRGDILFKYDTKDEQHLH
ncbi:MAG: double zinc ribbon domain-containing protein, partial [Oscillospiraceae bacterium]|nr:double zinc ribbon domain-containing protein [Oscillospiraceae bacterium]